MEVHINLSLADNAEFQKLLDEYMKAKDKLQSYLWRERLVAEYETKEEAASCN